MTKKKKRWILLGILGAVVAGGALVAARGKDKSDKPDEPIHMHEKMKFITVATGPTPVS